MPDIGLASYQYNPSTVNGLYRIGFNSEGLLLTYDMENSKQII
jgi:hypothetical protein